LLQGSDGIAEMTERAREMGLVISSEGVQSLYDYGSQVTALQERFQALSRVMVLEFLPYSTDVISFIENTGIPVFRSFMDILGGVGRMLSAGDGQVPQRTAEF